MGSEITTKELAKALGTTPQQVGWWVRRGMPYESRNGTYRFAPAKVEAWLLKHGLIKSAEDHLPNNTTQVAKNRRECGDHFGVHEHTVSAWQRREGFPGRPADPGKRNGHYPIHEIDAWLKAEGLHPTESNHSGGTTDNELKAERVRLMQLKAAEKELELGRKRGELIEVATVTAFMARQINQAGALIDEIPDRAMAKLPPDVSQDAREAIYSDFVGLAKDLRAVLGELVSGDEDDVEAV